MFILRKFLIVIGLILACFQLSASRGALVFDSGDTLIGDLKYTGFGRMKSVEFKLDGNADYIKYTPEQVFQIIVSNRNQIWQSISLEANSTRPEQQVFIKVIAQGDYTLVKGNYAVKGCGCDDLPRSAVAKGVFVLKDDGEIRQVFFSHLGFVTNAESIRAFLGNADLMSLKRIRIKNLKEAASSNS